MVSEKLLNRLGREEERLLAEIVAVEGTIEAKFAELEARGILRSYANVHRKYVELAVSGDIEALKRAIFLQWFENVEPASFSGLANLDREAVARTMELVEARCAVAAVDDELGWMLPFYFLIAEWAFPPPTTCPRFTAFCKAHAPKGLVQPPAGADLRGRGQMGAYWREVQQRSLRKP